jgi:hypothetical protein
MLLIQIKITVVFVVYVPPQDLAVYAPVAQDLAILKQCIQMLIKLQV